MKLHWQQMSAPTGDHGARLGISLPALRGIRGHGGASIVEVLVSVVVLAIIIVPIFDSLVAGRVLAAHRGETRMALRLVERKTEQLINAGYGSTGTDADVSSTNLDAGTHPANPTIVLNPRDASTAADDLIGDLTWTVVPVVWPSPGDSVYAKVVEVKLRWPFGSPRDSLSLTSLIGM